MHRELGLFGAGRLASIMALGSRWALLYFEPPCKIGFVRRKAIGFVRVAADKKKWEY
jgi:hypothetical protein